MDERVDDLPCPWRPKCHATVSVPVGPGSRDRRCWSCKEPVRAIEGRGPRATRSVRLIRGNQ